MDSIPHWFRGVRLNFAENILYTRSSSCPSERSTLHKEDSKVALTEVREGASSVKQLTWGQLRTRIGQLIHALRKQGVKRGDRVAVVASNSFDTFIVLMATTAIGALFSSSSTDMGTKGVLDRLVQIEPRWVFVDDFAVYNGKKIDLRQKMREISEGLRDVSEFQGVVVQPRFDKAADVSMVPRAVTLERFLEAANGKTSIEFERVEFRDPFLVVYSSGTTGTPKCIVHSTGGVLLSAMKERKLHRGFSPTSVQLQYTTVIEALHYQFRCRRLTTYPRKDWMVHVYEFDFCPAVWCSFGFIRRLSFPTGPQDLHPSCWRTGVCTALLSCPQTCQLSRDAPWLIHIQSHQPRHLSPLHARAPKK